MKNTKVFLGLLICLQIIAATASDLFCQKMEWTCEKFGDKYVDPKFIVFNSVGDIFVGGERGVYRSTNNGNNWTLVNSEWNITSLVIDFDGNLFVGSRSRLLRSIDNGETWVEISTFQVTNLCINSDGELLAGFITGFSGGLFISKDKGESWSKIENGIVYRGRFTGNA